MLLFVLAILALVYKRQKEQPRRPMRVWSFDVSKQARTCLVHTFVAPGCILAHLCCLHDEKRLLTVWKRRP